MEFLAKGKRGMVYKEGKTVVKKPHPDSKANNNLQIEADFLKKLNEKGIGPKFISFENDELRMEYIEGERILDYFEHANKEEILFIVKNVLEQCNIMDKLGINKQEMTNPYKHVIVHKGKPVMIDFERCRYSEKPHNITQFIQFLISANVSELLQKKKIIIEKEKAMRTAENYLKDLDVKKFLELLQI